MRLIGDFDEKNMKDVLVNCNLFSVLKYSIENEERLYNVDDSIVEFLNSMDLDIVPYKGKIIMYKANIVNKVKRSKTLGLCRTMYDVNGGIAGYMVIVDKNLKDAKFKEVVTHELTHVVQNGRCMFDDELNLEYKDRACEIHAFEMGRKYINLQVSAKVFRYFKLLEIFNIIKI
ncbi:MAG: hypothetical protein ACRCX8_05510 [Sarcina sp.]